MRVLSKEKRRDVLHLLIEGNSIRSTERLAHVHRDTVMKLLVDAGTLASRFSSNRLKDLRLRHVQLDEIWTFVLKKQKQIKADECDLNVGDQYTFVAIDQDTKLVPSIIVGKRNADNCERFLLDLAGRIESTKPGEPRIKLQLSSDGFAAYPGAVDLAFANTVDFGVIVKDFKENNEALDGMVHPR